MFLLKPPVLSKGPSALALKIDATEMRMASQSSSSAKGGAVAGLATNSIFFCFHVVKKEPYLPGRQINENLKGWYCLCDFYKQNLSKSGIY